jgi:hypothetical protein
MQTGTSIQISQLAETYILKQKKLDLANHLSRFVLFESGFQSAFEVDIHIFTETVITLKSAIKTSVRFIRSSGSTLYFDTGR